MLPTKSISTVCSILGYLPQLLKPCGISPPSTANSSPIYTAGPTAPIFYQQVCPCPGAPVSYLGTGYPWGGDPGAAVLLRLERASLCRKYHAIWLQQKWEEGGSNANDAMLGTRS
ncbi:hypothetical protein BaRGS_00002266 [Batillaria attramentaria]|uniref:Uncharacterized protein n=1 Tax=Batillaria attramentaria TaxID=370345 RepID=A0ABD0M606_9CAEN